jgi:TatD DNase family protein
MPLELFDTHAHLQDEQLEPILDRVIKNANDAGVKSIVCIGTTAETSQQSVEIAQRYAGVHAAVGYQPNYCHEADEPGWQLINQLAKHPAVVAIGETGLDKYWDYCPFETQRHWFVRHIALSIELGKPFVVHMRDCEVEIIDVLKETLPAEGHRGIMHSFSGSMETANASLDMGLHISFAGMVTFKKSADLREIAKRIPLERTLIETDSPYLSPHPKRGQRPNEPALIQHTAACLAEVHGISLDEFAAITTENARKVFSIA